MTDQTFANTIHFLDFLYKLWPLFAGVFVVGVVYWRTGSFFFVFHQFLKWLGLEGKYTCPDDQRVADEYLDLNKFNLKTGFRLSSVKAKKRLHEWMRQHDFEYAELRHAGWYFKANTLTFHVPGTAQLWWTRIIVLLISMMFILGGQFIENPKLALLKVNATDTWFWVGDNEATSFRYNYPTFLRGDAWKLQQGDCRYGAGSLPLTNDWDKNVMCLLVLGFEDSYIKSSISSQNGVAFAFKLLGFAAFLVMLLFIFWQRTAARLKQQITECP